MKGVVDMTRLPTIEELPNDPVEVRARQAAERGDMKILSLHEVEEALRTGSPLDPDHYVAWPTPDDGFCQQIGTYLEELRNGKELVRCLFSAITEFVRAHPQTTRADVLTALIEVANKVHSRMVNALLKPATEPKKPLETPVVKQLSTTFDSPIPAVEWNDKGPRLDSRLYLDMCPKIRSELEDRLTAWEIEFLDGRKLAAERYPQVNFTNKSAKLFEKLCYRAKIACPFHISPDNA
jgi:hypothetical protein